MALNQTRRGRLGATITEATIVGERNVIFKQRVTDFAWTHIDNDVPAETSMPVWDEPENPNKLNKDLLWEIVGPPASPTGTDEALRDHLMRELTNREAVFMLMQEAVSAVRAGTTTAFMTAPLAAVNGRGCTDSAGNPLDLQGLMRMLHMFGKRNSTTAPRPVHPINASDYFYTSEAEVALEIQRRVRELVAGISWEGDVIGARERKKMVWNRHGFYCGCG